MWTTIVELEFWHLMNDPMQATAGQKYYPLPDVLQQLNTEQNQITPNGFFVWNWDGSAVHAKWNAETFKFHRMTDELEILMDEVRAWAPLPTPVARS